MPRLLLFLTVLAAVPALAPARTAHACGGFFCSSSPINQAREVVVYGLEPDGTLTMAVQVQYEGRDEDFAWILPVPVPPDEIAVGTDALFDGLVRPTEPLFQTDSRTDGTCRRARCRWPSYGGCSGFGCAASDGAFSESAFAGDAGAAAPPGRHRPPDGSGARRRPAARWAWCSTRSAPAAAPPRSACRHGPRSSRW